MDNAQESLVWVDHLDNVLGRVTSQEAHENRDKIHRAVEIVLCNPDGHILMQQRSLYNPGKYNVWSTSAWGHVLYPDAYETTAHLIVAEDLELGAINLKYITKQLVSTAQETEMKAIFIGLTDITPTNVSRKINQLKWVSTKKLARFISKNQVRPETIETYKILNLI